MKKPDTSRQDQIKPWLPLKWDKEADAFIIGYGGQIHIDARSAWAQKIGEGLAPERKARLFAWFRLYQKVMAKPT